MSLRIVLVLMWVLIGLIAPVQATETNNDEGPETAIESVLKLGPLPVSVSHFNDAAKGDEMRRALIMQMGQQGLPHAGREVSIFGRTLTWESVSADTETDEGLTVWAFNLEADRFVRGHLQIEHLERLHVFHDGQSVSHDNGKVELNLAAGTHPVWLVHQGGSDNGDPALTWTGRDEHDAIDWHLEPRQRVSARRLTNAETVGNLALSSNGRYLALSFSARSDEADMTIRRLEIRDLNNDRIVRQWTRSLPGRLAFSPDSGSLAVQEGNNLWLHDLDSGKDRLLLANHSRIGAWRWHRDGTSILFAWTDPHQTDNDKRRRIRSLEDRWAGFRDNSQLYQVDVASGLIRPLTAKSTSVTLQDVHPDGDRLLVSERLIDYEEPPHSLFRLFEVDLDSLDEHEIGQYRQLNAARFAEDGYWLLAGPGLAQGDGATTGEDLTPNEYDTQLYLMDRSGEQARSHSRDFDPAFSNVQRLAGGDLLLSAVEGERHTLVRYNVQRERSERIDAGVEIIEQFVTGGNRHAVVRGTDVDRPQRVHMIDLRRNRDRVIHDSADKDYADVELGRVEAWSFTNENGDEIEGRYYLPPGFDAFSTYPLIVYYYGGTTPVNRQFTGRYPFHLWAAKGYVVYVLQPRGTIGYGQEFSALHVNAWGQYTADDIIEGTERFIEAHPFIDGERVGNIGASYGGFMTMHLATLTDRYAASISHAGISALTSYWGQGWWGYGYSGIASRGSFPWNKPELYVGQSPVYSADRITTPLLLVTGDSDTNVPPGESHNMFTALKLLGREVELVEFPGEDHWIVDREQRYVWWDTMLAWFDKWLKDEPQWWHHLYPETAE